MITITLADGENCHVRGDRACIDADGVLSIYEAAHPEPIGQVAAGHYIGWMAEDTVHNKSGDIFSGNPPQVQWYGTGQG